MIRSYGSFLLWERGESRDEIAAQWESIDDISSKIGYSVFFRIFFFYYISLARLIVLLTSTYILMIPHPQAGPFVSATL